MNLNGLRLLAAVALVCGSIERGQSAGGSVLPPTEARQWLQAMRSMKTDDGSTVAEVLAYAQKMRPDEFRAGKLEIISQGVPAKPVGVGVEIFIGQKRRADDAITLSFEAKLDGHRATSYIPMHPQGDWPEASLLRGRDAFLQAVDKEYQDDCIAGDSGAKSC